MYSIMIFTNGKRCFLARNVPEKEITFPYVVNCDGYTVVLHSNDIDVYYIKDEINDKVQGFKPKIGRLLTMQGSQICNKFDLLYQKVNSYSTKWNVNSEG